MNGIAINYFSASYKEARQKFLEASHYADLSIESFKTPYTSLKGDPLFTDVTLIGPKNSKTFLVLVSGTHGVEGFAGSSIQTGLLREEIASRLNNGMSIIMIHALNPYGFAHLRRSNENNVDLNRNFLDHSQAYPRNSGYEELAETVSPESISLWENTKARLRFLWYRIRHGKLKLQKTISRGQFTHPQGLFYGGQSETWSNKTINKIANRYLSQAKHVVVVDFHTGLGPYGNAEVILNEREGSSAHKRALQWWGEKVKTTVSGQSFSVPLQGTLNLAFTKMLPNAELTAVGLEFGTFSPMKVFWALRSENWLHHYGGENHPDAGKIKNELRQVFYPDSDEWKQLVWHQGKEVIEQALVGILFKESDQQPLNE